MIKTLISQNYKIIVSSKTSSIKKKFVNIEYAVHTYTIGFSKLYSNVTFKEKLEMIHPSKNFKIK